MPWVASDPITIVVPGKPQAQGRQRHGIRFRRDRSAYVHNYMPEKSANAQATLKQFSAVVMGNRPPIDCPVQMFMIAYMPIPPSWSRKKKSAALEGKLLPSGRPDLDNLAKCALDGITDICISSDAILTSLLLHKRYSEQPRLVLELSPLTWQD